MHELLRNDPEIWDLFTRKEEYTPQFLDEYDRFPSYASQNRNFFEPKASQYLMKHGYSVEYPDKPPFAVCLTHDIDFVYKSTLSKGIDAAGSLRHGKFTESMSSISQIRSKKVPFCNFSTIMDIEEKYGAVSTFFFMVESPGEREYSYTIDDLKPEIGNIIDRGWEVGLHGGHTAYLNEKELKRKKRLMEKVTHKPVLGYRNHYLRFKVPDTWEYLSKAGFLYDTTFGYADCAGFRNGMCHPFRPFNLNTGHEIDIFEIPLIVMDDTLGHPYMRFDNKGKWEFVKTLIDRVAGCHGVFTLLWHNYSFLAKEDLELYEKILRYCSQYGAWMTNGEKIVSQI
jgi:peptidoglycan/xylan/chitin deacetylase (PgdA/CDA1 family)